MIDIINYNSQELLVDENWRKTDYYELCTKNEFWGCAYLISLKKQITKNPNAAFIYIVERFVIEGESWTDEMVAELDSKNFTNFIYDSGYISRNKGSRISVAEFWKSFVEIRDGMSNEETLKITKNAIETESLNLTEEEIVSVLCFEDEWNRKEYFIETENDYLLFNWGTTV